MTPIESNNSSQLHGVPKVHFINQMINISIYLAFLLLLILLDNFKDEFGVKEYKIFEIKEKHHKIFEIGLKWVYSCNQMFLTLTLTLLCLISGF